MNSTRSVVLWGICALLVFAPLALGAVHPWAYTSVILASLFLFLVWAAGGLRTGQIEIPRNPVFLPAGVFGLLVVLQIALGGSAYPQASWTAFLKLLSYGLVFFLLTAVVQSKEAQGRPVGAILTVGFLAAFVGILQSFSAQGKIYWMIQVGGDSFGPYINRNHFAGLMEMTVPLALGVLFSGSLRPGQWPLFAFLAVVMGSALALSGSRGGILAFVLQMVCFVVLFSVVRRSRRWLFSVVLIIGLLGGMLYWLGLGPVLARVSTMRNLSTEPSYEARLHTYGDTWKMFRAHPIFGAGFGTYADVFPAYKSEVREAEWTHAHNDYLELLAETGVCGGLLAAWFLALLLAGAFRALQTAQGRTRRGVVVGALVGIFGILIHSLADFNLHIPANALIFVALAALTQLSQSQTS